MSANDDYEKRSKNCPRCGPVDRRELYSSRCPRGVSLVQIASAELVRKGRANASTTRMATATRQSLVRRLAQLERVRAADQAHAVLSLAGFDGDLLTQVGAALAQLDGGAK